MQVLGRGGGGCGGGLKGGKNEVKSNALPPPYTQVRLKCLSCHLLWQVEEVPACPPAVNLCNVASESGRCGPVWVSLGYSGRQRMPLLSLLRLQAFITFT